jgi:hypothetical protein
MMQDLEKPNVFFPQGQGGLQRLHSLGQQARQQQAPQPPGFQLMQSLQYNGLEPVLLGSSQVGACCLLFFITLFAL